ncbi:hypothetical protein Tco_1037940, partial [Tanacetum coccineum]
KKVQLRVALRIAAFHVRCKNSKILLALKFTYVCNITHAMDGVCSVEDGLYAECIKLCTPNSSVKAETKVTNMRLAIADMHLKLISFAREMSLHRDTDTKDKSELGQLKGN